MWLIPQFGRPILASQITLANEEGSEWSHLYSEFPEWAHVRFSGGKKSDGEKKLLRWKYAEMYAVWYDGVGNSDLWKIKSNKNMWKIYI